MISPLIVDIYAGDLGGKPDIGALVDAGAPWHGLILKATEGTGYNGGAWDGLGINSSTAAAEPRPSWPRWNMKS